MIQPDYNHAQINYVHELHQEAIKAEDVAKTVGVSAFMVGYYFRLGYDVHFREYWNGQRHKTKWQPLGGRNIATLVLTAEGTIGEFPAQRKKQYDVEDES